MIRLPLGDLRALLGERTLVRLAIVAAVVFVLFSVIASPFFFSLINFQSMGFQVAEVGLLSLAVMLSMLTGGIDLSIVSVAAVASLVTAQLFRAADAQSATGGVAVVETIAFMLVGLLVGTACGLLNGLLITRIRITPILATLGTMQLLNGLAIVWTGGEAVYGMPDPFLNIGTGTLFEIPIPVIVLLVAAVLTAAFINRTGTGLRLKLVGANPVAARYSGLDNDRVLMLTYVGSAMLASVAGVIIAARSASASADYGASYVLLAIVITMLAGVNPNGGYATVTGVVVSAFTLQMVSSGMNQIGWNAFHYLIVQGTILIAVIGLNSLSEQYALFGWLRRSRKDSAPGDAKPPDGGGPPAAPEGPPTANAPSQPLEPKPVTPEPFAPPEPGPGGRAGLHTAATAIGEGERTT
jgi:simple sugar transport system permease protein